MWCLPVKGARTQISEAREKAGSGSRGAGSFRRRQSEAERRRIVAESYRSGELASAVARRHGVHTSVLFRWRRQQRKRVAVEPGVEAVIGRELDLPGVDRKKRADPRATAYKITVPSISYRGRHRSEPPEFAFSCS